jgi:hypothetical protein
MTESSPEQSPAGYTIRTAEELPDFVNLLNLSTNQVSIPSFKNNREGKPDDWIHIKGFSSVERHKSVFEEFPIEEFERDGSIIIEPVYPSFDIQNETARRIGIPHKQDRSLLVIPAFGTQRFTRFLLDQYDYLPWTRRNLATVRRVSQSQSKTPWYITYYFYGWLLFFGLFFFMAVGSRSEDPLPLVAWQYFLSAVGVYLLAGIMGFIILRQKEGELGRFSNLVALILSAALPIGTVMYFYSGVANLIATDIMSLAVLGRGVQLFLILLASLLPGLMYFQFERQRVDAIRDRFFQEIMQLNPNVVTREDARISYGSLVDEISGVVGATNRQYALLSFGLPILLATWLIALGWIFALDPFRPVQAADHSQLFTYLMPASSALNYAFLGAYFFALNLVFRRYARGDLVPKAYNHITVRILSSLIVVWVIGLLPFVNRLPPAYMLMLAFLVGMFPESGVAFIQDLARKKFIGKIFPSLQEKHPITDLEGINLYDRVRLLEEGVESVENLVHFNPIELLLRTRMPLPRLIDLVDQAILYLHVRGESEEASVHQANLRILRKYGIRTATDLIRLAETFREDAQKLDSLLNLLSANADSGSPRLVSILQTIKQNVWINYLMHWRDTNEARDKVYQLEDFYAQIVVEEGSGEMKLAAIPSASPD